MSSHRIDQFHSDPTNWKLGIFYVCRADPRIIVPKRIRGLGWTINLARPMALPMVVVVLGAAWGLLHLLSSSGVNENVLLAVKIALAFGIIAFCYWMANRRKSL